MISNQSTTAYDERLRTQPEAARARCRSVRRETVLRVALHKRSAGVPTYTVPEAAALLSVSQEHLYRLIKSDAFPALNMQRVGDHGRYIVPARAVEAMLDAASATGSPIDTATYGPRGGAAR